MTSLITFVSRCPWLSGGAIWAITAASAALNAWGWASTAAGLVSLVLVTLAISSEVLGVRLALRIEDAVEHKAWAKVAVAVVLMSGVVAFNCYSGHRALEMVEHDRSAPFLAAQTERTAAAGRLARIEAQIASIPALPSNAPASRLREYRDARSAELARLEPQRSAAEAALARLPVIEAPPPSIPTEAKWLILILVEALKALALWAVVTRPSAKAQAVAPASNPASELARKRWGLKAQNA